MKLMKRKIIGLLIVTLVLATIPLISATEIQPAAIGKKKTFVSGFILAPPHPALGGMYNTFFAFSLRAGEIGGTYHIYRLQPIFVKASYDFHGIALPGFIIGWFDGPVGLMG